MGRRGPPPKPTALRVLHGDRKDRINTAEPVPPSSLDCPDWLSDAEREIWQRIVPVLARIGVARFTDADAAASMCNALAEYRAAAKMVHDSALLCEGENGVYRNPAIDVRDRADKRFAYWAARFGLAPSDRAQLKVEKSHEKGDDLLSG